MNNKSLILFSAFMISIFIATAVIPGSNSVSAIQDPNQFDIPIPDTPKEPTEPDIIPAIGNVPLHFVENKGQLDAAVVSETGFVLDGRDKRVFFTPQGVTFLMRGSPPQESIPDDTILPIEDPEIDMVSTEQGKNKQERLTSLRLSELRDLSLQQVEGSSPHTLNLEFVNAHPAVEPKGEDPTPTIVSYFQGPPEDWKTGLTTYSKLKYQDLWPGIDLVYHTANNYLKYDFVLQPGADPTQIRLAYRGATSLQINEAGELEVTSPVGDLKDEKPTAYQMIGEKRNAVPIKYDLNGDIHEYGFEVGEYDPTKPLVIDPAYVIYASYFGEFWDERGLGIAIDSHGATYITGEMQNILPWPELGYDVFVAKLNPEGSAFDYIAIMGGIQNEYGFDIDVDAGGNAYVTGAAVYGTLPVLGGPDTSFNGIADAFAVKLNPTGDGLIWSGYIGGTGIDFGERIIVDDFDNVYITGVAESTEASFPAVVGPDLTHNGQYDTFVVKLKADPTDPIVDNNYEYAGFIGGTDDDVLLIGEGLSSGHLDIDDHGNAYVGGMTRSTEASFPDGDGFGSVSGFDQTHNGEYDAYVVKVNPAGTGLEYATFIGGVGDDIGFGMAVDGEGSAHLTGFTDSTEASFPVLVGPDLTFNGFYDAFVTKLSADGTALLFNGYIGGVGLDQGLGLALDNSGNIYITGYTTSQEDTFPVIGGPDLTYNSKRLTQYGDAFIAKLTPDGSSLLYNGYIGGDNDDAGYWVVVDDLGNAYIVGETISREDSFPDGTGYGCALPEAADQSHNGYLDAFVTKISTSALAPIPSYQVITQDTTLTANFTGNILIAADDVTLNCDGYSISPAVYPSEGAGICLEGWDRASIQSCQVQGFPTGIMLKRSSDSSLMENTTSDNQHGYDLREAPGIFATENSANYNSGWGFRFLNSERATITNNIASQNNSSGFYLRRSPQSTVTGNTASDNRGNGIRVDSGGNHIIQGNLITSNRSGGLFVSGTQHSLITENTSEWNSIGFDFSGITSEYNTIENNSFNNNSLYGIFVSSVTNSTFTGNTANDAGRYGIYLAATYNTFTGNTANGNGWDGIGVFSDFNNLTANSFNSNGRSGIYLLGNNNTFTENTIEANAERGFYIYGASYNTLTSNSVLENGYSGLQLLDRITPWLLRYSEYNLLTGNIARGNGENGFETIASNNTFNENSAIGNDHFGYLDASGNQLIVTFTDPAGDQTGSIDVEELELNFNKTTGSYEILLTANDANPFFGNFQVHVYLYNPDTGSNSIDPSLFVDSYNEFDLSTPTKAITLQGVNSRLREWKAGDRVATSGPDPIGIPDGYIPFFSSVEDLPWEPGPIIKEDGIALGEFTVISSGSGSGTAGTENAYSDNTCLNNLLGGSSPEGLCTSIIDYLEKLRQDVLDLDLSPGLENGLLSKLDEALKVLMDDNLNNDHVAINKLLDFIDQIDGQRGKKISETDADALVLAADYIIAYLEMNSNP